MNNTFTKDDFEVKSWTEYEELLDQLYQKISQYLQENNIKIDALVPILRGGAIPGTILAYKLKLINILPVQYKYLTQDDNFETKGLLTPDKIDFNLPVNSTILLVDNNHCTGKSVSLVIEDLKAKYHDCKILYAVTRMDYSYQKVDFTENVFYGELSNETRTLTEEKTIELGIGNKIVIFPWESLEEQLAAVNQESFDYQATNR